MTTPRTNIVLLSFLQSKEPVFLDDDHPELADGSSAWVRKLRAESDARIARIFADS
jgi:hypothetical protein